MRLLTPIAAALALLMPLVGCPDDDPVTPADVADTSDPGDAGDAGDTGADADADATPSVFRVTVFKNGIGAGLVISDPPGIDCGNTCSADFDAGTEVTFRVQPDVGVRFGGFSNGCTGYAVCTITVNAPVELGVSWAPHAVDVTGAAAIGASAGDDRVTGLAESSFGTMFAAIGGDSLRLVRLDDVASPDGDPAANWGFDMGPSDPACSDLRVTSLPNARAIIVGRGGANANLDPNGPTPIPGEGTFIASYADSGSYVWSDVFEAGCPAAIHAAGTVVAFTGEVAVAGAAIDQPLGTNPTATSMVVAAFNSDSGSHIWSRAFATDDFDVARGRGIAVDGSGGLVVAGRVVNTGSVDFGGGPMPAGSSVVLARFDPGGNHVWSTNYGGIDHDVSSLQFLDGGDILMTGVERIGAMDRAYVARLGGEGGELWVESLEYAMQQAPMGAVEVPATPGSGGLDLVVAGWRFTAGTPFAEATLTRLSGVGVIQSREEIGSPMGEERALVIARGSLAWWIGGWFSGSEPWEAGGAAPLSSAGNTDGFVLVVTDPADIP